MGSTTDNDEVKYEYDAAGREVKIEATAKNRTEPIYDGDGQVLALPKFIWQTTTSSYPSTPGRNTLLIRSSVLGGKVVSEALGPGTGVTTAAGSMSRSRVIADGTEVATLKVGFGGAGDAVLWPMIDPAQSSYRDTNGSGAVPNDPEAMAEMDPARANVQTENPYDSSNPGLLPPVGSSSLFSFSVTPMDQRVLLNVDNFVTPNSVSVDGMPMSLADLKTNWGYALIGNQFDLLQLRAFGDWFVRYDGSKAIGDKTKPERIDLDKIFAPKKWLGQDGLGGMSVFHFWQANSEGLSGEPQPQIREEEFLIGRFKFSENEMERLAKAYERVTSERCRTFFDNIVNAMYHRGEIKPQDRTDPRRFERTRPRTLAGVMAITSLNKYGPNLTARAMGVSQAEFTEIQTRVSNGAGGVITSDGRVFLPNLAFYVSAVPASLLYTSSDLSGIIVHEYLHRAGFSENQILDLHPQLQANCGIPGWEIGGGRRAQ